MVAILGRPNVGKSTLFNRIVGGRRALVDDAPGVTRDRLIGAAEWLGQEFRLIDTGGFEAQPEAGLAGRVREQSLRAVADADVVILLLDGRAGVAPADLEAARFLARLGKPIVAAVNKIDGAKQDHLVFEFFRLGLDEPLGVSAEHGRRVGELLDRVVELLPRGAREAAAPPALHLAILGRPNVGKSSLLNRLAGEERVLVHESPGTTRDSVDTEIAADGERYLLVDTAGVRRRSRIDTGLERASVARAIRSLERAEVALLVIDAAEPMTDQDARLARLAWDRGKGLVLVANKWDRLPPKARDPEAFVIRIRERYAHLEHVPAVAISALRGTGVGDVLPAARAVSAACRRRIPTRELNDILSEAVAANEPPTAGGKRARIYYAASAGIRPPTVILFVNHPRHVTVAYLRYLERKIREAVPLVGTPLRLVLRERPRDSRRAPRRREQP